MKRLMTAAATALALASHPVLGNDRAHSVDKSMAQRYAPGQLAGGADGLVLNPRTGQREPVHITFARDPDSGQPYETGYYFSSDGEVPTGAQPSAAAQYHRDDSGIFDNFL